LPPLMPLVWAVLPWSLRSFSLICGTDHPIALSGSHGEHDPWRCLDTRHLDQLWIATPQIWSVDP
jgi:hypothetical protein